MRIGEEKEGERRMKEEGKGEKEWGVWGREGRGKKNVERGERGEGMRGLGKRGKGKGTRSGELRKWEIKTRGWWVNEGKLRYGGRGR